MCALVHVHQLVGVDPHRGEVIHTLWLFHCSLAQLFSTAAQIGNIHGATVTLTVTHTSHKLHNERGPPELDKDGIKQKHKTQLLYIFTLYLTPQNSSLVAFVSKTKNYTFRQTYTCLYLFVNHREVAGCRNISNSLFKDCNHEFRQFLLHILT